MSAWDGYVDHLMVDLPNGGKLESAAIVGQDGGVWAQSPTFPAITTDQVAALLQGFANIEKEGHVGADMGGKGIFLGDMKFQVVPGDETAIRGKTSDGGCCIKKTNTALVIGIYKSPVQAGDCNVIVENLGDYLVGQQY